MHENDLGPFFEPRGVALVGARRSPGFGYGIPIVLKRQGWEDRLRLVNPAGGELHGMPVYESIADVPDPTDLAVLIVPARTVPGVLEEIGVRGIRHAIIETAGFAEVGDAGRALQVQTAEVARKHGIRVIGPNCVGVVNTATGFTTVEIVEDSFTPGSTSIIAQSGVFGNVLLDLLPEYRLYISKAATLGNRMDVNECDLLDHFLRDTETRVIMMYLEGAADGKLLRSTLSRVARVKPVLVLKSGRTSAGRAATASHTGSLSGEDDLYSALFSQTGAIRAGNLEELVEMARVFSSQPLPCGNHLGIVTSSGSLGVMATDAAVAGGLQVAPLPEATVRKIKDQAPEWMNVKNPLDVGPSNLFAKALTAMMEDPEIDMVLAINIFPFAVFRELKRRGYPASVWFGDIPSIRDIAPGKPLVVSAVGNSEFVADMRELCGAGVPVFGAPEPAASALAALYDYGMWRAACGEGG
jgi:acyl-CoA synthetase (NDP forming)